MLLSPVFDAVSLRPVLGESRFIRPPLLPLLPRLELPLLLVLPRVPSLLGSRLTIRYSWHLAALYPARGQRLRPSDRFWAFKRN